ncbi:restriction endonuclease subunit S [Bergeyella porcorum]|uniref:restriction endonuclease subunit S n=1 Tax=Bergeyella porcorum TaxID=1735111 RepID=UPI0035E97440
MSKYKVIFKNDFTYIPDTSRRGDKIGIALLKDFENALISQAYTTFRIVDENKLLPEYLMMWFSRPEFDRYARFYSIGSVRETFDWEDMCDVLLPIPSIEKQREIVAQYQSIAAKIKTNEALCEKLEATAQALYKHWFVDFEFPNENGKPYFSSGGEMVYHEELQKEIPKGWEVKSLGEIAEIIMGQSPESDNYNEIGEGKIFYQGRTDFGFRIPEIRVFTKLSKKNAKKGDVLMSVRAPVGDVNIADNDCSIGRGIASISSKEMSYLFYLMKDFKSHFDLSEGTGTIFSSINKDELFELKVVFNKENSVLFNEKIKYLDEQIIIIEKQSQTLKKLQSLLLVKMGEGVNL